LKVDEPIPSSATGATGSIGATAGGGSTQTPSSTQTTIGTAALPAQIGNNITNLSVQNAGLTGGSSSLTGTLQSTSTSTGQRLTTTELQSAISLAAESMLVYGMSAQEIINYFLNVQSPGYKLYVGITKKIFTDAVKGIFDDADLRILNNYGNTNAGQTNGGSASSRNSNFNQTGGDNGSSDFTTDGREMV
jgi:hypothetical protein